MSDEFNNDAGDRADSRVDTDGTGADGSAIDGQVTGDQFYNSPLLIKSLFHTALAQYPHREIVYADFARFSYLELRQRISRLASALGAMGVRPGDTVAVMDWDTHRYLECFFALPMMGCVLHTVNIRLAPEQILYTVNHATDDWIFVHEDFLPVVEEIGARIETKAKLVLLSEQPPEAFQLPTTVASLPVCGEYESILASGDSSHEFADFDENTRATTFYTTGTTGEPKGVYYSHRQIMLHTMAVAVGLGMASDGGRMHRDDVYMPITPMFHVHAWGIPFVATMIGLKQVYPGRYEPDRLLKLIQSEAVTFSHCVPTIMRMLLSSPLSKSVDLSHWKVVIGGSALPRALAQEARALGIDIFSGYGMSETCPVLTLAQSDLDEPESEDLSTRCLSGRALPLVELQIIDADGNELAADARSTGELVARAPWLTRGYYANQSASDELWKGGYLHTGDIASIDERGYVSIQDRIKDVIKTGGEWISSVALEDLATRHPDIAEAAAIGVSDDKWGERPVLLVVATNAELDEEQIIEGIRELIENDIQNGNLSKWAMPDRIEFSTALPKTSVGKLDKKLMRSEYQPS